MEGYQWILLKSRG
jgi:hypothetical protein